MQPKDDWVNLVFSFFFINLAFFSNCAWGVSLGGVADNLMGPASSLTQIMFAICYIAGTGFLLGSIVQYKAHRDNPTQVRLTVPVFLFVIGLVLVFLPFISRVAQSGRLAAAY